MPKFLKYITVVLIVGFFRLSTFGQEPPGGCLTGCQDFGSLGFTDYCSCINAYADCAGIEDGDGNQVCIPVNANSWVLFVFGISILGVSFIISKKVEKILER
jgi:hypothetical protein